MDQEKIRDSRTGKLLGYIQHLDNGDKKAYDERHMLLGTYRKSTNKTLDDRGMLFTSGDTLAALIYSKK